MIKHQDPKEVQTKWDKSNGKPREKDAAVSSWCSLVQKDLLCPVEEEMEREAELTG